MKIELEYTKEELSTILDGLNNAIIAVGDIYAAAQLSCNIPKKFEPLFEGKSFEEIDELILSRKVSLHKLYQDLLTYETI